MLEFSTVKFKNFLSYGNDMTEFDLQKHSTNLVVGKNGAGKCCKKSTIINIDIKDEKIKNLYLEYVNAKRSNNK